ncbi:MAG: SpoIID/LytB domain-containing protein [Acidobacteria bacterium]|nr:SpoIID/LytB domain-containing protein [Acidobacteriota bacterium]
MNERSECKPGAKRKRDSAQPQEKMQPSSNVAVGVVHDRTAVDVELLVTFIDAAGKRYAPGRYHFTSEITVTPEDPLSGAFAIEDVTIGIGFHWERNERQLFRGGLRIVKQAAGLTAINDVSLEDYVTSVISSEMSASCPPELLKAHAVIARSWLKADPLPPSGEGERVAPGAASAGEGNSPAEIIRWYGRSSHSGFEVCADDHCQRYQGITRALSDAASQAVTSTRGQFLTYNGLICDTRFYKCCGGMTDRFSTAWQDIEVPYLKPVFDGSSQSCSYSPEALIRSNVPAYCNTTDVQILSTILPDFDQETRNFFRWRIEYTPEDIGDLIKSRLNRDVGDVRDLKALSRGPSGRIIRLQIVGEKETLIIGKELEIRRALSRSHLYSSAFVVDRENGKFVLRGAGWGHGVGLCQIGAAVMASQGKSYVEILEHYYPGAEIR